MGRKLRTPPTPPKIPSMTRDWTTLLTPAAVIAVSAMAVSPSIPVSRIPCKNAPTTLKVSQNTSPMIPIKAGIPVYFPVRNRSIWRLLVRSLLSLGLITVSEQTSPM